MRQFFAVFFIFIFVCGTATTAFVFQQGVVPGGTQAGQPATTPAPGASSPQQQLTPSDNAVQQLVQNADAAFSSGDWASAASQYKAALALSPGNATLHFKAGKSFINSKDYTNGVDQLQKALDLNPTATFAEEARSLVETYKGQASPAAGGGTGGSVTGTLPITSTSPVTP
jgi:hypothetical protein